MQSIFRSLPIVGGCVVAGAELVTASGTERAEVVSTARGRKTASWLGRWSLATRGGPSETSTPPLRNSPVRLRMAI